MKQLHEEDFNLWVEFTKKAIRDRDFEGMDWDNLLEEIDDMGASQKRALRSYYYRLVEHILKLRDWHDEKERNAAKWRVEVSNFRREINDILEDSPSLRVYLKENNINWFSKTVESFSKNKLFAIADTSAIPLETMMNSDFFGE